MKTNLSILLLFFFVNSAFGQTNFAQLEEVLLMLHKQDQFNGSILIAEKGKVTFKKSYGLSNQENKQLINENTIFEMASVSKQFTAMGIVILKEQGKLSYEDKVTKFFPELEEYKNISVRNLLNHTNGIPDYLSPKYFAFFDKSKINSNKDVIEMLVKNKVNPNFEPNTKFAYSNTGYILLASIIEKVSGQTFASFLQKSIIKPLKMYRRQIQVSPELLEKYIGDYQDKTNEKSIISLTKGDNWLFYNSTENKGWNLPLFAESNTLFFAKPLDIQIEFVLDGDKVSMIKLHQGGKIIGEATKIK